MKTRFFSILLFCFCLSAFSYAQSMEDVQVTGSKVTVESYTNKNVIVAGKTDLHITSSTPLVNSVVNLNSDDAWLFFDDVVPGKVIESWLSKVKVNGAEAQASGSGQNVRVAIHWAGTVVIPNGNQTASQALEIFTGQNFTGESKKLEIHTYYRELPGFNDNVRSFKLKRGYMATLAANADGTGYSRVFIADDADLEVGELADMLDQKVSFIRVFQWEWPSKKGWCSSGGGRFTEIDLTRSTWWYSWSANNNTMDNQEYVPIRQKTTWPGFSEINGKEYVSHLLGYNEPDHPEQHQDDYGGKAIPVSYAVEHWPEMMESGLRLGAPATTDFSWLYEFIDECDRLNYRVDYVAIHAYWGGKSPESWYRDLKAVYDRTKRPIWITEWNNGANWTKEEWPETTEEQQKKQLDELKKILEVMDTASFVERYSLYNWVEDKRALVMGKDDSGKVSASGSTDQYLTPAGEYYRDNKSQLAFNRSKEFIPLWNVITPELDYVLLSTNDSIKLTWDNFENGDILETVIECKKQGETDFSELKTVSGNVQDYKAKLYDGAEYRIRMKYTVNFTEETSEYSNVIVPEKDVILTTSAQLTGDVMTHARVALSWNTVEKARYYNIKRSLSDDGEFQVIEPNYEGTSYMDSLLTEQTTYYYKVSAANYAGDGANSNTIALTTKRHTVPEKVEGVLAASGDGKVTLKWNRIYDITSYNVKRALSAEGSYEKIGSSKSEQYVDETVDNGTTYYYVVSAVNEKGEGEAAVPVEATPVEGQYAYWDFNDSEGTTSYDQWNNFSAVLSPEVTWGEGKDGSALSFAGNASSYVTLPEGIMEDIADFTIATWVNIKTLSVNSRIFDFGDGTDTYMALCPDNGGFMRYMIKYDDRSYSVDAAVAAPVNQWVHIAVTQKGSVLTIYLNGEEVGARSVPLKASGMGRTSANYLIKSQWPNDPYLSCLMDEFRIYNKALSAEEIQELSGVGSGNICLFPREESLRLTVYPNPVQDYLNISAQAEELNIEEVMIYNYTGQIVYTEKMGSGQSDVTVNVNRLPEGMYIIKVNTDKGVGSCRMIKN